MYGALRNVLNRPMLWNAQGKTADIISRKPVSFQLYKYAHSSSMSTRAQSNLRHCQNCFPVHRAVCYLTSIVSFRPHKPLCMWWRRLNDKRFEKVQCGRVQTYKITETEHIYCDAISIGLMGRREYVVRSRPVCFQSILFFKAIHIAGSQ